MRTAVQVGVTEPGADPARLEELSLRLRAELLELDVQSVRRAAAGGAPAGARAGPAEIAGALVVTLHPTVELVAAVVALARAWLRRTGGRTSVRVEIDGDVLELGTASDETQRRLVELWIARHSAGE